MITLLIIAAIVIAVGLLVAFILILTAQDYDEWVDSERSAFIKRVKSMDSKLGDDEMT